MLSHNYTQFMYLISFVIVKWLCVSDFNRLTFSINFLLLVQLLLLTILRAAYFGVGTFPFDLEIVGPATWILIAEYCFLLFFLVILFFTLAQVQCHLKFEALKCVCLFFSLSLSSCDYEFINIQMISSLIYFISFVRSFRSFKQKPKQNQKKCL